MNNILLIILSFFVLFQFGYAITFSSQDLLLLSYSGYCGANNIQSWSCYWCTFDPNLYPVQNVEIAYDQGKNIFAYVGVWGDAGTNFYYYYLFI